MRSFWQIFWLETIGIIRSKTLLMLMVASVGWMLVFPVLARGDGTAEGARELYIHYSLGGVFLLLVIALLAAATGAVARERAEKRLQLTLVRPVRYFSVVFGKMLAYVMAGAVVLAISSVVLCFEVGGLGTRCSHVLSPVLPTPAEEAKAMYEVYMSDPETPAEVKRTKKEIVLRLLTQRALDHYQTIPTNEVVAWQFPDSGESDGLKVRMRFTNPMEMRQDVIGRFSYRGLVGVVSNMTQAVLEVPLTGSIRETEPAELKFLNGSTSALMLRPRKDINILVPADAFWANLARAYLEMTAILALVIAFGVFLSAALGRPVALFTAIVVLLVSEMSPSVVSQYPDELETNMLDRIGLHVARAAAELTHPVSALTPLEALSKDECIDPCEVCRVLVLDLVAVPVFLALLAALVMPRKQEDAQI